MNNLEAFKKVIEEWNLPIVEYSDERMMFRYNMAYVEMSTPEEYHGEGAVYMMIANIAEVETDKEPLYAKACNLLNLRLFQAKTFITDESKVTVATEFYNHDESQVEYLLENALNNLETGHHSFMDALEVCTEEQQLADEMNADLEDDLEEDIDFDDIPDDSDQE